MFRFVALRYSHRMSTMAIVLMSSAEWLKGLEPVKRIRYQ
jgi:hypothetical protein